MAFSPTLEHISQSIPGVKFTVHRIGIGRRTDIDAATLTYRQRLRELEGDSPPLTAKEKELTEQLAIAQKKAEAVPANEYAAVIDRDVKPLSDELEAAGTRESKKTRAMLDEEYKQVDARIRAEWIRQGLISIVGGEVDGMTAEQLIEYGPPALAHEIYWALISNGTLRGAASKNSLPPGTSGEVAGGESRSTTAEPAEAQAAAGTSTEIASGTSPGM